MFAWCYVRCDFFFFFYLFALIHTKNKMPSSSSPSVVLVRLCIIRVAPGGRECFVAVFPRTKRVTFFF